MNTNASNRYAAPLVSYGSEREYKPLVAYDFDDASQQNAFTFQFSKNIAATKIYLPPQQWHFIAVVYDGNSATLFCNGTIARKVDLSDHMPVYDSADSMNVGSNRIVNGAVTKVNYYTYDLSSMDVMGMYHLGI
jgi:Concanavalin A-like lectin/glucanases superfamily